MSVQKCHSTCAFGVEPGYPPYRLRQARYHELGIECAAWAQRQFAHSGRPLELLDAGPYDGVLRRYAEVHPGAEHIRYHGVDLFPHGRQFVYKHASWTLHYLNLDQAPFRLRSRRYDVVVCEQVLEHLHHPAPAIAELYRVLRPGGRLVLGVPIFPPGFDLIRKHVVPRTDRLLRRRKVRGHVQGWSQGSFLRLVRRACPDAVVEARRGFRIISGGVLRPLEYTRWWWRFNRRLGQLAPALCIEVQIVLRKPGNSDERPASLSRAA